MQECPAGLIPVRRADADRLAFAAPPLLRTGEVDAATLTRAVHAIGAAHDLVAGSRWADNGPGWLVLEITTPEALAALTPHPDRLEELAIGTFALTPGTPHLYEVRAFMDGIVGCEDPVTGSLNAGIAQELRREGRVPERYTVRQGTALGRDGIVSIEDDGRAIWVGGATTTLVSGSLTTR